MNLSELNDRVRQAEQAVAEAEAEHEAASAEAAAIEAEFATVRASKRKHDAWLATVALAGEYDAKAETAQAARSRSDATAAAIDTARVAVTEAGAVYNAAAAEFFDMDFIFATAINEILTSEGAAMSAGDIAAGLPVAIEEMRDEDIALRRNEFGGMDFPLARYDAADADKWLATLQADGPLTSLFYSNATRLFRVSNAATMSLEKTTAARSVQDLKGEAYDKRIERDRIEAEEYGHTS